MSQVGGMCGRLGGTCRRLVGTCPLSLCANVFFLSLSSDKYTRFCQWKNLELNIQVSGIALFVFIVPIRVCMLCLLLDLTLNAF